MLGEIIDNILNFASMIKKSVNRKFYSIKRLFYVCQSVKLHFFFKFLLPKSNVAKDLQHIQLHHLNLEYCSKFQKLFKYRNFNE